METRDRRKPFADRLREALEDGICHAEGEITLESSTFSIPDPPPEVRAEEVAGPRVESGLSRAGFARVLDVSTKTVRGWEGGARRPSAAALRMVQASATTRRASCGSPGWTGRGGGLPALGLAEG